MTMFEKLQQLRGCKGAIRTRGLADEEIRAFAEHDSSLGAAVDAAHAAWQRR